jgi:hypothetical protein
MRTSKFGSGLSRRATIGLAAALVAGAAGVAHGQPLRMEYDVQVAAPGMYEYWFKTTLDDTLAPWTPGMGWSWFSFGLGRRSTFLRTSPNFAVTSPWPIGPWTSMSTVGGGHNGPIFAPVGNYWIPTAVGDFIEWTGTSPNYVGPGHMRFATVVHTGGAQTVNFREAIRLSPGPIGSCCLFNGDCIEVSAASCGNAGGVYGGDGSTCATPCNLPTGACCREGGCFILNEGKCVETGGVFQGVASTCPGSCAPAPAYTLAPADFSAGSRVWVYSPSHSVNIAAPGSRATGFRLKGRGERPIEGHQADIVMELVAPNGTTLLLGGDNTSPLVTNSLRWPSIRLSGTSPATSGTGNASNFDGVYSWDFGPADGNWTVNFWNNFAQTASPSVPPQINWNDIIVTLSFDQAGSCCLPNGTCLDTAVGNCLLATGHYRGDGTACGGCEIFLHTGYPATSLTGTNVGQFLNLTPARNLAIHKFDYTSTAAAGTPTTVEVWTYPGSYHERDADPTGWVLHETIDAISAGIGASVPLPLTTPLSVEAGTTMGVYLVAQSGGIRYHTSGTTHMDANLMVFSDRTRTVPWAGTLGTSRSFGGRVYYNPTCLTGDCPRSLIMPVGTTASAADTSGIFLDLTATETVTIKRLDYYAGNANNLPATATVYVKSGSYVGFDTDPMAWTLVGEFNALSGAANEPLPLDLGQITLNPGETLGVYIVGTVGGYRYRASTSPNPVSDENLSLFSNHARSTPFGGTLSTARRFSGRVHYVTGAGEPPCYANCDGSTTAPILNVEDFTCFINEFAAASQLPHQQQLTHYANCDQSTTAPVLNVEDFTCFINKFAQGCP